MIGAPPTPLSSRNFSLSTLLAELEQRQNAGGPATTAKTTTTPTGPVEQDAGLGPARVTSWRGRPTSQLLSEREINIHFVCASVFQGLCVPEAKPTANQGFPAQVPQLVRFACFRSILVQGSGAAGLTRVALSTRRKC